MNRKHKKIVLIILLLTLYPLILYILIDRNNLYIDLYNFGQLNKAKPILKSISPDDKNFYSLKEFNDLYKADLKPVKNCYDISNRNGNEPYIFGFKLESKIFLAKYGTGYYAYPRYNSPVDIDCMGGMGGGGGGCVDGAKTSFIRTISNPCKD